MLHALQECGAQIYGVSDGTRVSERVPTLCFNLRNIPPATVTEIMANAGIGIRDGHMYAPRPMQRLGLRRKSGAVRASLEHYNTVEEVRRFGDVLRDLSKQSN